MLPFMTDTAAAFSGKKGSTYYTSDGGRIEYGSGDGGYSNTRMTDLDDSIGTRYAYCVQPANISPVVGKMTVDKVVTDENDTGKWNALRNIVYYSPSYPGYDNNVKNIQGSTFYNGDFTHDWAVAHLAMSYVYDNRPSDLPTFNGTVASDLGELWTSAMAMGDALWKSDSSKDDAVPDNFKVFISYQENAQDVIVGYLEAPGILKMTKSSKLTGISDDNGMYDFWGAEYTVYNSDGDEVGTLTTDAYGISDEIELAEGTYTVKETNAPWGYAKDDETYTVRVESEEVTTFEAKETPITAKIDILLLKRGGGYDHDHGEGDASLKGAVYKVEYYDRESDPDLPLKSSNGIDSPKDTWYFETNEKGEISGSDPKLASGYESSALYKDADGNVVFPLGVYVVNEVKASEGYLIDPERILITVSEDGTDDPYTKSYNTGLSAEEIMRGGVKIQKIDSQLNAAEAQGDATLEGAEFTIYNGSENSVMVNGKEYGTDEAVLTIVTDENGSAGTGEVLPYGSYSIKETKASEGYLLNESWEKNFEIREDGQMIDYTSDAVMEMVKRSGIQVQKRDIELGKSEALGQATLDGIVMTIKNVSDHDVVVRADIESEESVDWTDSEGMISLFESEKIKRVKPNEDVGTITIHWNAEKNAYTAETLSDDLPYGTYTIRESKTNDSYQRTDKAEHRFEVREDGTIYSYDDHEEILSFDNHVYRSDVQGTKIGDSTSERMSYVPFKITSVTTGETHVVVADKNGFFTTKDRRTADMLEEDESAETSRKINPFDDLQETDGITAAMIDERKDDILMGAWFGTGEFGSVAEPDPKLGALPFDSYVIEEMSCEKNEGYILQKFFFTVDEKSVNGFIDLETITDDVPEIETMAAVNGKNVDVKPGNEITLIDTIKYSNLVRGETYTVKGRLIDKATGDVIKDAQGNDITAEATFEPWKSWGKTKVEFKFDGSNMWGKETVVFETVYDANGHLVAKHEDINNEDQTVTWEKPGIGTTLTDEFGNKEVVTDEKTVLIDTIAYEGLDVTQWYVIEGTLILKDTGDPLVENGKEVTVMSEPFRPSKTNGFVEIKFEINTTGLEGTELVAFETAYRINDYVKGMDLEKADKVVVAEHKDINDEGQTVKIVKADEPETPVAPENPDTPTPNRMDHPKTGDTTNIILPTALLAAAITGLTYVMTRRKKH